MSIDDNKCSRILRASDLELARVTFKLEVSQGEEELGMVIVEDLVRNTGAVDAAEDLHVSVTIGLREVSGEAAIVWDGEWQLEESSWNIITPHLEAVEVATMDSCSEDGIDSEQEEWSPVAAYAVSVLAGGGVASIAQSLADMRSKELSGRNLSFRKQKNRKKTASEGTSLLLMNWRTL